MNTHSSTYGSTKGKAGRKVQKTHFLQHCVQASPTSCPQKSSVPTSKAHRALGNCDRMHEQTDFSTFSAKKVQKERYSPKNAIKGERNGLFQKGPKGRKIGEHLWESASPKWFCIMAYFCYPLAHLFYLRHSVLSPCFRTSLVIRFTSGCSQLHIWLRPTTLHFVCCRYCCLCLCVCQYMWSENTKIPWCVVQLDNVTNPKKSIQLFCKEEFKIDGVEQ